MLCWKNLALMFADRFFHPWWFTSTHHSSRLLWLIMVHHNSGSTISPTPTTKFYHESVYHVPPWFWLPRSTMTPSTIFHHDSDYRVPPWRRLPCSTITPTITFFIIMFIETSTNYRSRYLHWSVMPLSGLLS